MRKLLRFFRNHYVGVFIISVSTFLEFLILYNDRIIHGNWFFIRTDNITAITAYSLEFLLYFWVVAGGIISDMGRMKRLKNFENIKNVNFIEDVAIKLLNEPSFEKKMEIALTAIKDKIGICKSAVILEHDNEFSFYYTDNISEEDKSYILDNILSHFEKRKFAHMYGFLLEELVIYDLHGYVILKPCKDIRREQVEFLKQYSKILLPIFGNARLIIALNQSKNNYELLIGRYKMLHGFVTDLQKSSTIEEFYWKLVGVSSMFFGTNAATVIDVSSQRSDWRFVAVKNTSDKDLTRVEATIINPSYRGPVVKIKETKKIVYISDTRKSIDWVPIGKNPASWLGIPIIADDEVIGVLCIDGDKPNQFTNEDIIFAQALSDMISNIADRLKYMEELNVNASVDSLTGLYNKRVFQERIRQEINRVSRYGRKLSIVIFDLDRFKQWNDTYGHLAGDELLKEVGNIMHSSIRDSDIAFRFGGDEFVILFPETDAKEALQIVRKLSDKISHFKFDSGEGITISAGIAEYKNGDSPGSLLERADEMLYRAKNDKTEKIKVAV